ncbi:glycosyltransferase family 1 protein [Bremerella cremea]|uniref:Glycosyltransferase family 1 protein n=1 Tax=Bremerella cremea TaxID=1031537 RepID=A0A368KU67_9BACT|nr:glycosyltransferase family 4 protein [Bremerella cremea]RCS53866.1 glycosyltransferase family 1 protein [Bremerella cremea]
MPSVVYLCEYGTIYGGENSMLSGLAELKARGFEVAVACPPDSPLAAQVVSLGFAHRPVVWTDESGRRKPLEVLRDELRQHTADWQVDLVHANSLSVARILGPVERPAGSKFVGHLRDIIKLNRRVVADISRLDEIYCVSTATRDFHLAQGLSAENSCVLHNGIDLAKFSPPAERPDRLPLRLVYIGQLVMRKGVDVLLEGVRLAIAQGADVTLDLYGECHSAKQEAQHYLADLHRSGQTGELAGRVGFRGRTDDAATVLRQADVLVHAARQEPWGRVLLEAAACGLPIVATAVGGTREMFPAGECLLVPPDDPPGIAAALGKLSASYALRKKLGLQARQRMEQLGVSGYADKLVARYQNVLRSPAK